MRLLLLLLPIVALFLIPSVVLAQGNDGSDSQQQQGKSSRVNPKPPPGFKSARSKVQTIVEPVTAPLEGIKPKHVPLTPSEAYAKVYGKNKGEKPEEAAKQVKKMERIRDLLAEYRELASRKAAKGDGEPSPISEELKEQMKLQRAEEKASRARKAAKKGGEEGEDDDRDIPALNEDMREYFIQGDILPSVVDAEAMVAELKAALGESVDAISAANVLRAKRASLNFVNYPSSKWDKTKPIPYMFAPDIDATRKSQIQKALQFWSDNSCLSFVQATTEPAKYIYFQSGAPGGGCFSDGIGLVSGYTYHIVNLDGGCIRVGTVAHEIAHRLAFFHGQSRYDRDTFVTVYTNHTDHPSQYGLQSTTTNNNYQVKYDYGSVMHYTADSFQIGDLTVMVAKEANNQNTMGQRMRPAFSDLLMMNRAYGCESACAGTGTVCQNGGFPSPKNCAQCICPSGFGGTDCGQRQASTPNAQCTGATITASTTDWQLLEGTVSSPYSTYSQTNEFDSCYWHIKAPAGYWLDLWIEEVGLNDGTCETGCQKAHVEFKMGEFTRSGVRMCCQSDLGQQGYVQLTSTDGLAVVSAHTMIGPKKFRVWHIAY